MNHLDGMRLCSDPCRGEIQEVVVDTLLLATTIARPNSSKHEGTVARCRELINSNADSSRTEFELKFARWLESQAVCRLRESTHQALSDASIFGGKLVTDWT